MCSTLRYDGSHGQRRDQAGGSVRSDDEHTRGAEQRVSNQWWDDCVESHDGRYADDGGIGHALGHHHRPDGEGRHGIRQQPIAPVGRKPAEDGQQPLCDREGWNRDRHGRWVLGGSSVANLKIRTYLVAITNFGFKGTLDAWSRQRPGFQGLYQRAPRDHADSTTGTRARWVEWRRRASEVAHHVVAGSAEVTGFPVAELPRRLSVTCECFLVRRIMDDSEANVQSLYAGLHRTCIRIGIALACSWLFAAFS